ncbi:BMP family ABC transporter substrate-binding protein [Mesoplasma syrphidae]|uniref:BMP family ABC transporter substrate-binding protein n=1 Tax=Mesoplasma syrphidae TaxID=225999 RepID=A0A2K9CDV0_9MOLU|nr:BMP family ABC transporter substrate-binding protein [Mesoplasma syrphidae]AUF83824.1 BMP family ABC transporter substrate-binding protein [Mesoplasma syrphidae]
MKKLMLSLYTASAIIVTSTSVISCIPASYAKGPNGQRVLLVTDGGNVSDKSFNQGSYNSIKKYANELDDWNEVNDISYDGTGNYVESSGHTAADLISGYKMAAFKETDAMVLSGFIHVGTIDAASKLMNGKTIVLADGVADYSNGKNQNVISIQFNSELAGFAAGYDASIWANQNEFQGDSNKDGKIAIGTFAGMSSKYSVDNYMWGLILGMEVFNLVHKEQIDSGKVKEIVLANNYDAKENKYQPISATNVQGTTDARWFSQSFALGGATSSGILDRLITQNGADIIFPVAGPQISDVLSFSGASYNPYIIGVDVDQVESFPSYEGRFITSAVKNLEQAITDELRRSRSLKKVVDKNNNLIEINKKDIDNEQEFPIDDGTIAKPRSNWSVDTYGGKNLSKHTYVKYQDKAKILSLEEDLDVAEIIIQAFASAGENINDYMQGQKIYQTALKIKELYDKDKSWLQTVDDEGFE